MGYTPFVVRTEPPEHTDEPVIWENPDVPEIETILDGDVDEFACPYTEFGPDPCGPVMIEVDSDTEREKLRSQIVKALEAADGTLRCDDCGEPIYGLFGGGDY